MSTSARGIGPWLDELGSASATPGGGAAAGVAAATGAALIAMVGRLTVGKEGFEDLDARMRSWSRPPTPSARRSSRSPTRTPRPSSR